MATNITQMLISSKAIGSLRTMFLIFTTWDISLEKSMESTITSSQSVTITSATTTRTVTIVSITHSMWTSITTPMESNTVPMTGVLTE